MIKQVRLIFKLSIILLLFAIRADAGMLGMGGGTPVAAGGNETIGYTTQGATADAWGANYINCVGPATTSHAGTVSKITLYSSSEANINLKVGLYSGSGGAPATKVGTETTITGTGTWSLGWHDFTVSYSVNNATEYWQCYCASDSGITAYYTDPGSGTHYYNMANTYANAWPSTFSASNDYSLDESSRMYNSW
jgi:hypothetical protein